MKEQTIDGWKCIQVAAGRTAQSNGKWPHYDNGAVSLIEDGQLVVQVQGRHIVVPPAVVRWLLEQPPASPELMQLAGEKESADE